LRADDNESEPISQAAVSAAKTWPRSIARVNRLCAARATAWRLPLGRRRAQSLGELATWSRFQDGHGLRYLSRVTTTFDEKIEALIKMEVACRLALESLPQLPRETEEALRGHIETLCEVTERELKHLQPGYTRTETVD